jgi:hypothetical protein
MSVSLKPSTALPSDRRMFGPARQRTAEKTLFHPVRIAGKGLEYGHAVPAARPVNAVQQLVGDRRESHG